MNPSYWYTIRKKHGGVIADKRTKAENAVKEEKPVKVEKTAKEIELEARRAKYAAKKDEINARRRANRAAKKAAAKKTK